jgi:hypothetical protein
VNGGNIRIGTSIRTNAAWCSRLERSATIATAFELQLLVNTIHNSRKRCEIESVTMPSNFTKHNP